MNNALEKSKRNINSVLSEANCYLHHGSNVAKLVTEMADIIRDLVAEKELKEKRHETNTFINIAQGPKWKMVTGAKD
jgi:superoxide dismutase